MSRGKFSEYARVAELVDALDLGSSSGDRVGVQVSPLAPSFSIVFSNLLLFENPALLLKGGVSFLEERHNVIT